MFNLVVIKTRKNSILLRLELQVLNNSYLLYSMENEALQRFEKNLSIFLLD